MAASGQLRLTRLCLLCPLAAPDEVLRTVRRMTRFKGVSSTAARDHANGGNVRSPSELLTSSNGPFSLD